MSAHSTKKDLAVIDRFEGDIAILEVAGKEARKPRASLPKGAREGDVVDLTRGTIDPAETAKRKSAVAAARAKTSKPSGGNFDL